MSRKMLKRTSQLSLLLFALLTAVAQADSPQPSSDALVGAEQGDATVSAYSLTLVGGEGANEIAIAPSADGLVYVIRANGPIGEAAGCRNALNDPSELRCLVSQISSFVIRVGGGNDTVTIAKAVGVSTFLYGGGGADVLAGGDAADKLVGDEGGDTLIGRDGADFLYGLEGDDALFGGDGNDVVRGGAGRDFVTGGQGRNDDVQE